VLGDAFHVSEGKETAAEYLTMKPLTRVARLGGDENNWDSPPYLRRETA